MYKNKLKYCI